MEVGIWLSPLKDAPKPEREVGKKEYNEILYTKRNAYKQKERVQPVWNAGITGSGVKVAVVEPGKIKSSHQNLATGSSYDPSYGDDLHATEVAGIIVAINNGANILSNSWRNNTYI